MHDALILDTETTTNKSTPERELEVMELAFFSPDARHETEFLERFRPKTPPTWGAIATHGISMQEVLACRPAAEARAAIPPATYWIGHNIDFDWGALGSPTAPKRICTLALARSVWPELDSHTLTALVYFIHGVTPETRTRLKNAHSAIADCEFTHELYGTLCRTLGVAANDYEQVWRLSEEARIPKKMNFGKFKDQPISAVDKGYAAWYARQPDPDQYVLKAFRLVGLLR